jgi:hypothetical protein
MLVRTTDFVRRQRRLVSLVAALLLAVAVLATHSAMSADHETMHHGSGTQGIVAICLAVLESGVAIAVALLFGASRNRPQRVLRRPVNRLAIPSPQIAGLGPPGLRPFELQVLLR